MKFGALVGDDSGDDRDRPPIVLLHGLTFDRRTWRPVVDAFRSLDRDRRVVVLDLPGHGDSPAHPPHDLPAVVEVVHDALQSADIHRPVMVGHSVAGAIVSFYAGAHPVAGVVNVDQPPVIAPFAALLKSIESQLRGPGFEQVWPTFYDSFHTELLPSEARELVEATCRPRQDIVISYWSMILEQPIEQLTAMVDDSVRRVAESGVPYVLVSGSQLPDAVMEWMRDRMPDADVLIWDGSGHFPQLAHRERFADLLAATGEWPT